MSFWEFSYISSSISMTDFTRETFCVSMKITSTPVASVCDSSSLSILTSPVILHVWHLISSWPLTPKLSSSLRIWCHLKFKFLGPSAQPRSCHMGNRLPLAWQRSACTTGPTEIVMLAYLWRRESTDIWPITTLECRYTSHFKDLNDHVSWPVSLKIWFTQQHWYFVHP